VKSKGYLGAVSVEICQPFLGLLCRASGVRIAGVASSSTPLRDIESNPSAPTA
jgi:hypothetical protein